MSELEEKKNLCNRLIEKINRGETFTIETYADMSLLINALKKDIEYEWHDLTTNPNDLPTGYERRVLFYAKEPWNVPEGYKIIAYTGEWYGEELGFLNDDREGYDTKSYYVPDKGEVLKWRYLEECKQNERTEL